jgi:SAM-dependent methyltransferase
MPSTDRPDYGLDAPGVVRNLALATIVGLLAFLSSLWRHDPAVWTFRFGGITVLLPYARIGLWVAIGCGAMATWMFWESRVGKLRERERLLDLVPWTGGERVLDVGCGRGLMLIGAARRLTGGSATGIDLWRATDLSGNRPEATLANARLEGVSDRVDVETGDMRELPFPDRSFDVVLSSAAIHNLPTAADRQRAIQEIARVLAPGGHVVISDIRHLADYQKQLAASGCTLTGRSGSRVMAALLAVITFGALYPGVVVASAPAGAVPG